MSDSGGSNSIPTVVTFTITDPDGGVTTYVFPGAPEITNPSVGTYVLRLTPPTIPGTYNYTAEGTGAVLATSYGNFTIIDSAGGNAGAQPQVGPCQSWVDTQDVEQCTGTDGVDLTDYALAASQLLYALSGRQFAGVCEQTVRPCASTCGCGSLSRALLPGYPVTEILEVKIDGAVVDPSEYRLDGYRWLTRLADANGNAQFWPACQRLDLPDTETGTWSVTYRFGQQPPVMGEMAATQLACELWKAANNQPCGIPAGATVINRQGVTVSRVPFVAWAYKPGVGWSTGLALVDVFLSTVNPAGMMQRATVSSPDIPQFAERLG